METLAQIYARHCVTGPDVGHGDKGGTHSYIPEYERLLAPYREGCILMEIGVALGLSLAMWREYMPTSTIVGVDRSFPFDTLPHLVSGTQLIQADATKPDFIEKLGLLNFDVVIDDASHMAQDQETTFRMLKPRMKPGGLYVIEDILALDSERHRFTRLYPSFEILDLRKNKGRFDDVLILYHF